MEVRFSLIFVLIFSLSVAAKSMTDEETKTFRNEILLKCQEKNIR